MSGIKNILLIEDSPEDRDIILSALEESGITFNLKVIEGSQKALDYLFSRGEYSGQQITEIPDVILLDLNSSNIQSIESIRGNAFTASIPLVAMIPSNADAAIKPTYRFGANSVLSKPVRPEELTECIRLVAVYWLHWNVPPPR